MNKDHYKAILISVLLVGFWTFEFVPSVASALGIISTVAGGGNSGLGDGGPATSARLNGPRGVFVDGSGNIYIGDWLHHRIRKVDASGIISTVAGNGTAAFSGDGGPATSASLNSPFGVFVDGSGNIYIVDRTNHRIRKVDTSGIITTVAGSSTFGFSGDGGPATNARLRNPQGVSVDGLGNIYIADSSNNRIRKVDTSGIITTVAGNSTSGFSGDGGPATSASLKTPSGVFVDGSGNFYIADQLNHRIRKVDTSGIISTVAGKGTSTFSGDGGPATSASLNAPLGVFGDGSGVIYIADKVNHRIRKVDTSGIISTVAGNGTKAFSGDGGPATSASFNFPQSVFVDGLGVIYIADQGNQRIRKVEPPPSVTSIDPASGTELGGTSVTIGGGGFKIGGTVSFGDSSATNIVVVSDTIITAVTLAHAVAIVDVIVINPDGQADTLSNGFTFVSIDAISDTVSFDATGDRAAIETVVDTVKVNTAGTLRDSLLAVSYNVTAVLNPFVARVFDASGSEPGVSLTSKVIDPAGGLSQLASEGFTRFEDGRVSVGITQGQTLFIAMELSSAAGPSIGVNIGLDTGKSWTFDEIGGVTRWRRGSEFVGITGDGGFMIRTVTGIMGDVSRFSPFKRGVSDGEIGTEDLDFVVDVVLSRISESGASDVISGVDKVTRFLMDAVDGTGGGADGIVNLFDVLFVVGRL